MAGEGREASDLLTTVEVAQMLRVHRSTVTRYVRLGLLRSMRLPSGVIRIPRSEVERLRRELEEE
jgi:excisionase family DNA binding protein